MKKANLAFIIILIIAIVLVGYFVFQKMATPSVQAPAASAGDDQTSGWQIYTDKEYGFELKYPADFFDPGQQPQLLSGKCDYNVFPKECPNINDIVVKDSPSADGDINAIKSNLSQPGYWDINAKQQTINGTVYCLYATGDAATGHAFNYYYYVTVKEKRCLIVYLATATENCDFYLPLEAGNTEQADNYKHCLTTNENQPKILDTIISTFKFNQ